MQKLWTRALMLGALLMCLATAAFAGNVEVQYPYFNGDGFSVNQAADGFYLTKEQSRYGTEVYDSTFDKNGNLVKTLYTYTNEYGGSSGVEVHNTYANNGALVRTASPRYGTYDCYTYNADGTVATQKAMLGRLVAICTYSYPSSRSTVVDIEYYRPNGNYYGSAQTVWTLNEAGQPTACEYTQSGVRHDDACWTYEYDANGNLTAVRQGDGNHSFTYTYDAQGRAITGVEDITWEDSGSSTHNTFDYTYDEFGNLVSNGSVQYEYARIPEPKTSSFTDVQGTGASYYDPVIWAVENGVTNGMGDNRFSPGTGCTRGQMVTFLWRAAGKPEPSSTTSPFVDVSNPSAFYYKAVLWAVEKGITAGTDATHFSPDQTCTRGHIVTFMYRAAGSPENIAASNPFTDLSANGFYYNAVLWAVESGITTGMSATTFAPNSTCTRAQGVTFLYRGEDLLS